MYWWTKNKWRRLRIDLRDAWGLVPYSACTDCRGSGKRYFMFKCTACEGRGFRRPRRDQVVKNLKDYRTTVFLSISGVVISILIFLGLVYGIHA